MLWKIELKSPKLLYISTFNNSMKKNSGYSKESRTNPVILTTIERENVRLNSYIGKKGYTIPKAELPKGEEEFLKKDLFVKPFVPGAQFGNPNDQSTAFPVYRENINKMYLPRFYGIQRYGVPDRCDIEPGDDIDVPFELALRDYQVKIVDIYCNYVSKPLSKENAQHGDGGILEVPCGRGKCNGLNTPIMMYDGTIKMVQDIKVGDVIMGDDSTPRNILTLARGREQMYKVIPNKGDSYTVNESHILSLKYSSTVNKNTPKGTIRDISVLDYLNLPKSYHGKGGVLVGYRVPITFPTKEVDIDPYILGYWLGDGHSNCASITTEENEVVEYFQNYAEQLIGFYYWHGGKDQIINVRGDDSFKIDLDEDWKNKKYEEEIPAGEYTFNVPKGDLWVYADAISPSEENWFDIPRSADKSLINSDIIIIDSEKLKIDGSSAVYVANVEVKETSKFKIQVLDELSVYFEKAELRL